MCLMMPNCRGLLQRSRRAGSLSLVALHPTHPESDPQQKDKDKLFQSLLSDSPNHGATLRVEDRENNTGRPKVSRRRSQSFSAYELKRKYYSLPKMKNGVASDPEKEIQGDSNNNTTENVDLSTDPGGVMTTRDTYIQVSLNDILCHNFLH